MQDAVVKKIKSKIAHGKFGEVYFVSSFPQFFGFIGFFVSAEVMMAAR